MSTDYKRINYAEERFIMDLRELLGLTMYDADNGGGAGETSADAIEETPEGDNVDTVEEPENNTEEKTFTQAELDQIIADRLAREKKKRDDAVKAAEAEAERKRLEEQNDYKTLYEQAQQQAEQAKAEALGIKKSALRTQAGYSEEQAQLLVKLVEGDEDEAIAAAIKLLTATVPTQDTYADPSASNGEKDKPVETDNEEVGRNAVSRVLHKIKL